MVKFKRISWKNFLSTGNSVTEIDLCQSPTTLIIGENGSGKSTLLDAITFVLFGKPFRNINKPQLINSVNQKQLMVAIDFEVGNKKYKIVRGIKPNIFEIYADGVLLNQDASLKDYQNVLEEQILKFNYKSFTQIVILGSASFTPFMQLPAAQRREVIENLLDISIFSTMNKVLKDKQNEVSVKLINLDSQLTLAKRSAVLHKQYVDTLEQDKVEKLRCIRENKELVEKELVSLIFNRNVKNNVLSQVQQKLEPEYQNTTDIKMLEGELIKIDDGIQRINKEIEFFNTTDDCPTCLQLIESGFKEEIIHKKNEKRESLLSKKNDLRSKLGTLLEKANEFAQLKKFLETNRSELTFINSTISAKEEYVGKLNTEIEEITNNKDNINDAKEKLVRDAKEVLSLLNDRTALNDEKQYQILAQTLLKDSGIKTKIIKQYLPIINKLVNKYLQAMDLFIQFELDEEFKETIKSRYRDEFTYASFSEGEKQRINLALLFAWRTIASMRNTTNTNLLLFDEVLDGSLDSNATEYFLSLVKDIGHKTNIFVISHKQDLFVDKFDKIIKAEKVGGYSVINVLEK